MKKRKRLQNKLQSTPTLQDVAERAKVSTATVSRYLTNSDLVRQERRDRIKVAIDELGYIPHGAAQALASQRSRTIGVIVPTLESAIFARGIQAFQQHLQKAGYTLFIASSDYSPDEERTEAERLINRGVDGMMLIGQDHHPRLYERLAMTKIPYVNTWSYNTDTVHPCVGFNNFEAASRLVKYLIDIGHKRFGIISGITRDNDRARDRLEGILDTLQLNKIQVMPNMILECSYDVSASRQATKRMLAVDTKPTAIICGNDVLAFGAVTECQTSGILVPQDMSIVGFDDLPLSRHMQPPLTTMHVPSEEMGRAAADYLLARLGEETVPEHTELQVNLIVRDSAGPPRK